MKKVIYLITLFICLSFIACGDKKHNLMKNKTIAKHNNQSVMNEEYKQYINNSLSTGDTPYVNRFGNNYICPQSQCSGIDVTAPKESDVIVIIKHNNKDGKIIQHGYISAGDKLQFDIPNGTYQVFFYYGKGWNPNKTMNNGAIGGFVTNEVFAKDEPQDIYNCILSYILQLNRNGNFQTKQSNISEMF